jgi:flagellar hook assembly protein FlgD
MAWDGRDSAGQVVPSGEYVISATAVDGASNRSTSCAVTVSVASVFDSAELSPP